MLFRPLEAVLGSVILLLGGGIVEIALLHTGISWLQALRGLWLVATHFVRLRFHWHRSDLLCMLQQGLLITLAGLGTTLLIQGPLVLYRQVVESAAALGQMALVLQILSFVVVVPLSVSTVAMPILSRAVARRDRNEVRFIEAMCRVILNSNEFMFVD